VPGETTRHITVFLVDDHALFRTGVRTELGSRVHVVGEAGDVDDAIQGIRATRPDVVLLDVHLPGGGGVAVLEAIGRELPTCASSRSPCRTPRRT
jgi:DNA-binding NarL/FixJ family response regulator